MNKNKTYVPHSQLDRYLLLGLFLFHSCDFIRFVIVYKISNRIKKFSFLCQIINQIIARKNLCNNNKENY